MEEKPPPDDDDDDRERDVSEDPFLSTVLADLESVGRWNDYKLGVALAAFLGAAYLYDRSGLRNPWIDGVAVVALVGIIGFTIFRNVREGRQVAVKHGLRCPACGHTPPPHMVMDAALLERCAKCKSRLRR